MDIRITVATTLMLVVLSAGMVSMRLVCPNCDAEYEVDPSVIPETGRDVQCSNCGTAWFQASPVLEMSAAEETDLFDAPDAPSRGLPEPAPEPEVKVPSRGLAETVVAVLREEAQREAAARRTEVQQPIETQTEMGLSTSTTDSKGGKLAVALAGPAARHIAKMKGAEPEPQPVVRPQTRREMLPAIEEINSTLRAASEKRTGEPTSLPESLPDLRQSASGFRNGFMLMLIVAAIGVFAYVMADRLTQQIPGLASAMSVYVSAIDTARIWLDGVLQQAISTLRAFSGNTPA